MASSVASDEPPRKWDDVELEPAISACQECFQKAVDLLVRDKTMGGLSLALLQHQISPEHFDSVLNMLSNRHEQLKTRELRILIAGESAAGKTTFMNILMGGNYLPIGYGPETKTVCELRYRTNRSAKLILKSIPSLNKEIGISGESSETINSEILELSEDADDISWSHLAEVIRTAGRDYNGMQRHVEKVELYWPVEFIKIAEDYNNTAIFPVVLIDCPGITEDESSFGPVLENAKTCDGFVFVVNVSSAYGVERKKMLKLLEKVSSVIARQGAELNQDSALFITNKWDLVDISDEHKREFQHKVLSKLRRAWSIIRQENMYETKAKLILDGLRTHPSSDQDRKNLQNRLSIFVKETAKQMLEGQYL